VSSIPVSVARKSEKRQPLSIFLIVVASNSSTHLPSHRTVYQLATVQSTRWRQHVRLQEMARSFISFVEYVYSSSQAVLIVGVSQSQAVRIDFVT
jgi:hypothetical protein